MNYAVKNLFGIPGFDITWYGIIILCGMILGVLLAIYHAKKAGYREDLIIDFVLIGIPAAIVGARAYYVLFNLNFYLQNPGKILAFRQGGLAIYGGVIAGVAAAWFFTRYHHFPFLQFLDIAIPSLLVGQIVGRWGNYANQEAYGNLISAEHLQFFPYGVYIDALGEWRQATFFYESMWNLILLCLILFLSYKGIHKTGSNFALYLSGYGLGRLLIEGLRDDSLYLGSFRISQLLSLILAAAGILLLVYVWKYRKADPVYNGKYRYSMNRNKISAKSGKKS